MWEWSNRILNKSAAVKPKSLLAAYNDLLLQNTTVPAAVKNLDIAGSGIGAEKAPPPPEMENLLKTRLKDFGLCDFELREYAYEPQTWQEMNNCFKEYHRIREVFLKLIGYSYAEECRLAGLNDNDISLLRQSLAPENFNTHLKIPFDFGGTLDFDNFCLIKTHPVHDFIHRLIDIQIENNYLRVYKKIFLPWFEGKIYRE